jgi:hypothetical protein
MKYLLILVSTIMLLMSCSSVTVKHDYDASYDFSQFKTYRWAAGKEINPDDELQKHPLVAKRVYIAVNKVLKGKGLVEAKEGEPFDVVVLAHAGTKQRTQVTQTGGAYMGGPGPGYRGGYRGWYDPWWGSYGGTTTVSQYEEATLVIDIVSWKDKKLAWRGMATGVVKDNQNGQEQQERLNKVVEKIFENYPPGKK